MHLRVFSLVCVVFVIAHCASSSQWLFESIPSSLEDEHQEWAYARMCSAHDVRVSDGSRVRYEFSLPCGGEVKTAMDDGAYVSGCLCILERVLVCVDFCVCGYWCVCTCGVRASSCYVCMHVRTYARMYMCMYM
jgi:hypothetical protein